MSIIQRVEELIKVGNIEEIELLLEEVKAKPIEININILPKGYTIEQWNYYADNLGIVFVADEE